MNNIYTIEFHGKLAICAKDEYEMENLLDGFRIGLSDFISSDDPDDDPYSLESLKFDYATLREYEITDKEED